MGHMSGLGKEMSDLLTLSAELEELDLPRGEFIAKNGKLLKISLLITAIVCTTIGLLMFVLYNEEFGLLFLLLGVVEFLILPTLFSYRCVVNKTIIIEEYFILFLKRKKEILWSDVKYQKVRLGHNKSIKLYDSNKRILVSFDNHTVGFSRILKLVKRKDIRNLKD